MTLACQPGQRLKGLHGNKWLGEERHDKEDGNPDDLDVMVHQPLSGWGMGTSEQSPHDQMGKGPFA